MLKWEKLPGLEAPRAGHTATLVGKKIFVFGGRFDGRFYNDLWSFDIESEQWSLIQEHAPFPQRAYHSATLVSGTEIWIIGGSDDKKLYNDVHVLKLDRLEWSTPALKEPGLPRATHTAVLHPLRTNAILIYAGYGGQSGKSPTWLGDLAVLWTDSLEWEPIHAGGSVAPSARGYHSFTAFGQRVLLFGGKNESGTIKENPQWIYDALNNKWLLPTVTGHGPSPRSNHAAVLMKENSIVLYGGRQGTVRVNDIFAMHVSSAESLVLNWKQYEFQKSAYNKSGSKRLRTTNPPEGRAAHCIIALKDSLYILAGYGGQKRTFSDLYMIRNFPCSGSTPKSLKTPLRSLFFEARREDGWINTKKRKEQEASASMASCTQTSGIPDPYEWVPDDAIDNCVPKVKPCSTKRKASAESLAAKGLGSELELKKARSELQAAHTERECLQETVSSLQRQMEAIKSELQDACAERNCLRKTVTSLESQVQAGKNELQAAHAERECLQNTLDSLQKQLETGKHAQAGACALQRQVDSLMSDVHRAQRELQAAMELKEREKQDLLRRAEQELQRSVENLKGMHEDAVLERDEYKCCVQKLEAELQKQTQALQQARTNYESERTILLQEIAERKGTADRIFMELGTSKEALRAMQENVQRLTKQVEQSSEKLDRHQRDKEELNRANGALSAEIKQLMATKMETESSLQISKIELESARMFLEQNAAELKRLKNRAEEDTAHISTLRSSLKSAQDQSNKKVEECERLRNLLRGAEEFERTQLRLLQGHIEKLQSGRQQAAAN